MSKTFENDRASMSWVADDENYKHLRRNDYDENKKIQSYGEIDIEELRDGNIRFGVKINDNRLEYKVFGSDTERLKIFSEKLFDIDGRSISGQQSIFNINYELIERNNEPYNRIRNDLSYVELKLDKKDEYLIFENGKGLRLENKKTGEKTEIFNIDNIEQFYNHYKYYDGKLNNFEEKNKFLKDCKEIIDKGYDDEFVDYGKIMGYVLRNIIENGWKEGKDNPGAEYKRYDMVSQVFSVVIERDQMNRNDYMLVLRGEHGEYLKVKNTEFLKNYSIEKMKERLGEIMVRDYFDSGSDDIDFEFIKKQILTDRKYPSKDYDKPKDMDCWGYYDNLNLDHLGEKSKLTENYRIDGEEYVKTKNSVIDNEVNYYLSKVPENNGEKLQTWKFKEDFNKASMTEFVKQFEKFQKMNRLLEENEKRKKTAVAGGR